MKIISSPGPDTIKVVRRTARIVSLLLILIVLYFFMAEEVFSAQPRTTPLRIDLLVLGALLLVGLGLAWKWERLGALLSLFGFIGISILNPNVLIKPFWYIFAVIALLFLLCWWGSKQIHKQKEK